MLAVGNFSLRAPFGLLALLLESLHFSLAFLVRNGHQLSFQNAHESEYRKRPTSVISGVHAAGVRLRGNLTKSFAQRGGTAPSAMDGGASAAP